MSTCRVCGCTDERACHGGCFWVEQDLCSSCAKLSVKSSIIKFKDSDGYKLSIREDIKVIGEDFDDTKEAEAFIYGFVEGSSNLSDFEVIIPGRKYIEISIHDINDEVLQGYVFEIKESS